MADRISDLPDHVLCHILSFLPTKVAVSTSLLSKRWKPLWRSVPAFDFECIWINKRGVSRKSFNSINTFLSSRDPLQSLRRFCLVCYCHSKRICHPRNVLELVSAAVVQHKFEHLELKLHDAFDLPSVVLNCKTLVVLKLGYSVLKGFSSVDLPSLKTLHLHCVFFSEYKLFEDLLFGCPNLEDIKITGALHFDSYATEAKLKKLPKLVRAVVRKYHIPFEVVSHVQFLRIEWMNWEEELEITEDLMPQFLNLTHIEFHFFGLNNNWLEMFKVLEHCPNVQHLVIDQCRWVEEEDRIPDWQYPPRVPTCISSHLKTCRIVNYGDYQVEIEFARYIMQNARELQNMSILAFTRNRQKRLKMRKRLSLFSSSCKVSVKYNDV